MAVSPPLPVTLVVDAANVVGSRPDGWWRDRAGATRRLLSALDPVVGRVVRGPTGEEVRLDAVVAVVEGRAAGVPEEGAVLLRRAPASGDDEIVAAAVELSGAGPVIVISADRGLRERLPQGVAVTGPGWLRSLVDG